MRQSDIAEKTNRSQAYISKFEKGDLRLDLVDFALFCRSIGCDPHEVFDEIFGTRPRQAERTRSQAIGLAEKGDDGQDLAFEVQPLKRLPSDSALKDH
ncbi:helix-turn-helix domain-containing protein [Parasphingorhabdus halotolerans]|uniref:helix-turn-helix domain-containing protein n=1 Tax=Parasphingorhabdus halotolerans TaxID=2725558 RepID=UPI001B3A6775|nr:helix-turn-helix transcriptional regulator [Parasphingorhabdus halotolerans]